MSGGGVRQRFIFYTQKNHKFRICLPKKNHYFFLVYPKKPLVLFSQPKKFLCFFSRPKIIPASFVDPKKNHFWQNFRPQKITRIPPPVIKICEWSPWAPARCATVKTRIKVEGRVVRVIVHPPTRCFARLAPNEECEESRKRSFRCICFLKRRYFK